MLRVLLVDDERLVRAGFRMILDGAPDLEVVGEAEDGAVAIELARALVPDVVLMDLRMEPVNGVEATRRILAENPAVKIIVLTTFDLDEYVYDALRAGISGYLLKDTTPDQLTTAVRVVAGGQALLDPGVARRLVARFAPFSSSSPHPDLERLTDRELDVLREVAKGVSNAEIAARLFISETTVKSHIGSMLSKLGFRDRTQLIVFAYERGVVVPGTDDLERDR
jgi:DNA-binding NarL/FixJ family response regulator